jgi:carotenoid cleavage dioxygenase-like enzyme
MAGAPAARLREGGCAHERDWATLETGGVKVWPEALRENGARVGLSFGAADTVVEEQVLAPRPGSAREGADWRVRMGYDIARRRSFRSGFNALLLADGPPSRPGCRTAFTAASIRLDPVP